MILSFFQVNTGKEHKVIKTARISGPDDVTSTGYDTWQSLVQYEHRQPQQVM